MILVLLLCLIFPAVLWGAQASLPYALTNGSTADGGEVDSNFDEIYSKYNDHDTATTGVHGAGAGSLVTTTGAQTLTNKTLTSPVIGTSLILGATNLLYLDGGGNTLWREASAGPSVGSSCFLLNTTKARS
jgi:hypothetical protein